MRMYDSKVVRFLAVLASSAAAMLAQTTSQMSGKVVDQTGKPIPAAQVRYQRLVGEIQDSNGKWVPAPGQVNVSATAAVDAQGVYAASALHSSGVATTQALGRNCHVIRDLPCRFPDIDRRADLKPGYTGFVSVYRTIR